MISLLKDKRKNMCMANRLIIGHGRPFHENLNMNRESMVKISQKFTLEEIHMILLCNAKEMKDKDGIIKELRSYLEVTNSSDVAELIQHSIFKVQELTEEELKVILDYPTEQE